MALCWESSSGQEGWGGVQPPYLQEGRGTAPLPSCWYPPLRSILQKSRILSLGFPCGSVRKESASNAGDLGSIPGLGRSPGEGKRYTPVFWPGEFHGLYSPRGGKESDVTERLSLSSLEELRKSLSPNPLSTFRFIWPLLEHSQLQEANSTCVWEAGTESLPGGKCRSWKEEGGLIP